MNWKLFVAGAIAMLFVAIVPSDSARAGIQVAKPVPAATKAAWTADPIRGWHHRHHRHFYWWRFYRRW